MLLTCTINVSLHLGICVSSQRRQSLLGLNVCLPTSESIVKKYERAMKELQGDQLFDVKKEASTDASSIIAQALRAYQAGEQFMMSAVTMADDSQTMGAGAEAKVRSCLQIINLLRAIFMIPRAVFKESSLYTF